jgi:hypothetical protein
MPDLVTISHLFLDYLGWPRGYGTRIAAWFG